MTLNVQVPEHATALLTVDEFEQIAASPENADRRLELVYGEIVQKPMPTQEHGLSGGNLFGPLWNWVTPRKLGRVVMEVRYGKGSASHNARIPDISFSANPQPLVKKGNVPYFPNLAVEIKSPDDSLRKLRAEARFYIENGVQMVWLVLPETRLVEVYTADDEFTPTEADILTGEPVLPGFTLPVGDIFADPIA